MKTVIVGCGRVGAGLADIFDRAGHEVIIVDLQSRAFDRLPGLFRGNAVRGDGTDEDVLRRAGGEDADLFLALTEGDNRNAMAAQMAIEALGAKQVVAKINDPVRAGAYAELGIATLCRTNLMMDAVLGFLGMPTQEMPGLQRPRGSHHGADHDHPNATATAPTSGAAGATASAGAGAGGRPGGIGPIPAQEV